MISLTSPAFTCSTTCERVSSSGFCWLSAKYENTAIIKTRNITVERILFQKLPGPTGTCLRKFCIFSRCVFFALAAGFSSPSVGVTGAFALVISSFFRSFSKSDIVSPLYRKPPKLRDKEKGDNLVVVAYLKEGSKVLIPSLGESLNPAGITVK